MFSKSWHRVCPSWWNIDDDVSGGFFLAVQTTGWQRKQCNLSKGKATAINSFFITVMFSYCSGGRVLSSAEWYISAPPPLAVPVSVLGSRVLSLRWYGSAGMSMCAGTWFSSMPRPQSTAVSFVIVDFRRCHGFALGGWGAAPEGLIFPTAALYWIIPHSLVQVSRGGVKQLTCDMSPQPHCLGMNLTALLPLKYSCCCHGRSGQQGAYNAVWILLVSLAGALWFQLRTLTLFFDTVRAEKEISRHCPPLDSVQHYLMEDRKWNLLFPLFAYVVPSWLSTSCVAKLKWRPCFDPLSIPIWCFYVFWHMMKCVVKHHCGGFLPNSCNLPMRIVDREVR